MLVSASRVPVRVPAGTRQQRLRDEAQQAERDEARRIWAAAGHGGSGGAYHGRCVGYERGIVDGFTSARGVPPGPATAFLVDPGASLTDP